MADWVATLASYLAQQDGILVRADDGRDADRHAYASRWPSLHRCRDGDRVQAVQSHAADERPIILVLRHEHWYAFLRSLHQECAMRTNRPIDQRILLAAVLTL